MHSVREGSSPFRGTKLFMARSKRSNSIFKGIPVIDVAPLVKQEKDQILIKKTVSEMKDACRNVGFFYITNHHISDSHIESLLSAVKGFFDLPLEEKLKINIDKSNIFRGYTPLGEEVTNGKSDWHECIDFGPNPHDSSIDDIQKLTGPNQWPGSQNSFKKIIKKHMILMSGLGKRITQGLSISLGLPKNYFWPFMNESHNYMRISKYPPNINTQNKASSDGIGSHIDYGFLTILLQDQVQGLEIEDSNGQWFKAPIIPGTFLINIGHMIQRWTNGYYRATVHRVVSPKGKSRLSVPFFFEPNYDTVIKPIEKFCTESTPIRYSPLHFGEYLEKTFKKSYSDIST